MAAADSAFQSGVEQEVVGGEVALFPGHVVKFEKSGLVSTVCACAAPQVFLGNLETSGYYAAISLRLSSYYRSLHAYN